MLPPPALCVRLNETKAWIDVQFACDKNEPLIPSILWIAFCAFLLRLLIVCFNSSFIGVRFFPFAFQCSIRKITFLFIHRNGWIEKNEDAFCIPFTVTKLIFNICAHKYFFYDWKMFHLKQNAHTHPHRRKGNMKPFFMNSRSKSLNN